MTAGAARFVGSSVPRVEDGRILTGRGRYLDDLTMPGMLHGVFLRSTVAHATITSINTEYAATMPGVVAIITGADIAANTQPMQSTIPIHGLARPTFSPMAHDRVRHIGDPVVFIIATDHNLAEDARDMIELELTDLPVIATPADSCDPSLPTLFEDMDSNVMYRDTRIFGDPDSAFASAAHVVRDTFRTERVNATPMECRGGLGQYDPGTGQLVYYAGTQAPHVVKAGLVALLGHPAESLQVIAPQVGGSFGQKSNLAREDVVVAYAAKQLGAPVKWVEDRVENLVAAPHARDEHLEVAVAVSADGRILAMDVSVVLDQGAYSLPLPPTVYTAQMRTILPGPYRIDHIRFDETIVVSNKASYGFYRGPWAAETLVREVLLDRIAATVGLDRAQVRRVNLVTLAEQPRQTGSGTTLEGVHALEALDRALALSDYPGFAQRQAEARRQRRLLGLGISTYIEPAPGPPDYLAAIGLPPLGERAIARLELNGHLSVITSQAPHGQGHETTLAQVAATEFGVPMDHVRVIYGDTEITPFSVIGTGGSRAATMASGAVLHATRAVKQKMLHLAGGMLEIAAEDLHIVDGAVSPRGVPSMRLPISDIAQAAWFAPPAGAEPGLRTEWSFSEPSGGWSGATHVCIVEIDPDTAAVDIQRYVVAEDCGQLIHPAIVDGQIRGGVAQGIGQALYEHASYDTDANFQASTFLDYLLPTAMEIPTIEIEHLHSEPLHEVDFRGVGEGGTIAAPAAVLNAIADALHGARLNTLPIMPSTILNLIDAMEPPRAADQQL